MPTTRGAQKKLTTPRRKTPPKSVWGKLKTFFRPKTPNEEMLDFYEELRNAVAEGHKRCHSCHTQNKAKKNTYCEHLKDKHLREQIQKAIAEENEDEVSDDTVDEMPVRPGDLVTTAAVVHSNKIESSHETSGLEDLQHLEANRIRQTPQEQDEVINRQLRELEQSRFENQTLRRQNERMKQKSEAEGGRVQENTAATPRHITQAAVTALGTIPAFDGRGNRKFLDFKRQLETILDIFFPETPSFTGAERQETLAKALKMRLTDVALKYVESESIVIQTSYQLLVETLRERFVEKTSSALIAQRLSSLKQEGMSIVQLKESITRLVKRQISIDSYLQTRPIEEQETVFKSTAATAFRNAIRPEIFRELITKDVGCGLEETFQACLQIETNHKIIEAREGYSSSTQPSQIFKLGAKSPDKDTKPFITKVQSVKHPQDANRSELYPKPGRGGGRGIY